MNSPQASDPITSAPPTRGRFTWPGLAIWLPAAIVLGAASAWLATEVQHHFAPLLLFPMLVGIGLGAMLVGLMRVAQIGHRPTLLSGAVLATLVAVAGQHYASYREARQRDQQDIAAIEKAREAFPEEFKDGLPGPTIGFGQYMCRQAAQGRPLFGHHVAVGWAAWATWTVDGLLVLAAALMTALPAVRLPYCDRCRSWYRTTLSRRIAPATARQVADMAEATIGNRLKWARCRLSNCSGGCGPTRFELSWEEPSRRTFVVEAWLDAARRDAVLRTLTTTEL
jgi:hypothetical protein